MDRIISILDLYGVPAILAACLAVSLLLYSLKPIPHGHSYHLAIKVAVAMPVFWFIYRWKWRWITENKWLLTVVLIAGVYFAIHRLATVNPDAEIIHTYRSLFAALTEAKNPYDCGCIFHRAEFGEVIYGNFNYPPLEIWPYFLVYSIFGAWNSVLFTATLLVMQLAVCLILRLTFPGIKLRTLAAYFPVLIFFELYTNVATSFLLVALILMVIKRELTEPKPAHRYILWVLFGMGLLTKFIILPVFAAYCWHRIDWRKPGSIGNFAIDVAAPLIIATLLLLPFGVENVFRETVIFNIVLDERAVLTTYYPNVLSGLFYWMSLKSIFPVFAIIALGTAVLIAPKLRPFSAILAASMAFMFVSTTPEPQYIPVILYIALSGSLSDLEKREVAAGDT